MGYLKRFPVSTLKIDRSFIQGITADNDSGVITTAMIAMGHLLNLEVVAEGVESRELLDYLMVQGCDYAQGFYFSPPVPPEEFTGFLSGQRQFNPMALRA
jgi:EAL domain-containing protein (putative c-di-GMP-specific phosphodiesterase class I)